MLKLKTRFERQQYVSQNHRHFVHLDHYSAAPGAGGSVHRTWRPKSPWQLGRAGIFEVHLLPCSLCFHETVVAMDGSCGLVRVDRWRVVTARTSHSRGRLLSRLHNAGGRSRCALAHLLRLKQRLRISHGAFGDVAGAANFWWRSRVRRFSAFWRPPALEPELGPLSLLRALNQQSAISTRQS